MRVHGVNILPLCVYKKINAPTGVTLTITRIGKYNCDYSHSVQGVHTSFTFAPKKENFKHNKPYFSCSSARLSYFDETLEKQAQTEL